MPDPLLSPVALLDGIGCEGYVWKYLWPALAPRPVVHLHYRGHGRTRPPADPARVTVQDLADDVAAVAADARTGPLVLIGHSMGVQVALEVYRRHRSLVRGLVLVCGAPSHPLKTFRGAGRAHELLPDVAAIVQKVPGIVNRVMRWTMPTRLAFEVAARLEIRKELVDPQDFMPYLTGMSQVDARLFLAMLSSAAEHSAEDLLPLINVPTLVVAGALDGFTPPARSEAMVSAIPGAQIIRVINGSHTAPIERPDVVVPGICDFLHNSVDNLSPK